MTALGEQLTLDGRAELLFAPLELEPGRELEPAERAERIELWKENAALWLASLEPGRLFYADDLVRTIGLPDITAGANSIVGSWLSAQAKAGRIAWAGSSRRSTRPIAHGNPQRLWVIVR